MIQAYREIFKIPGSLAFSSAALVGRMPMAMGALGIITMLSQFHGEFAIAGAVAAIFSFALAVLGPQVSRLVDRYGQRKVLPVAASVSSFSMLALLLLAGIDAAAWTLFACAAFAGCMPSMSAMVRARWTPLLHGRPQLQTAYAFESVIDEVSFIIGPPLAIGLSVAWFPEAGLLGALLLQIIGVGAFVFQTNTEPPIKAQLSISNKSPLRIPGIQILVLLLTAMGVVVGTIDVVSIAFSSQQGQPAAASIVLSAYAVGACLAGLFFGTLNLNILLPRQLLYFGVATSFATLLLLLVGSVASLSIVMFISGLFFAPTMIIVMSLVENIVPATKLTEGLTWMISGLGIGMAIGAGVSGQVVDWLGVSAGFGVAISAGVIVFLAVTLGQRKLRISISDSNTGSHAEG